MKPPFTYLVLLAALEQLEDQALLLWRNMKTEVKHNRKMLRGHQP